SLWPQDQSLPSSPVNFSLKRTFSSAALSAPPGPRCQGAEQQDGDHDRDRQQNNPLHGNAPVTGLCLVAYGQDTRSRPSNATAGSAEAGSPGAVRKGRIWRKQKPGHNVTGFRVAAAGIEPATRGL